MDKEKILSILSQVRDPQSGRDLVSAGMVEKLEIAGDNVNFQLVIPNLQMPGKAELNFACIGAINDVFPKAQVNVHFMARSAESSHTPNPISNIKHIIAVASGKGGVGKSTVAVNLALGLQKTGAKVGILDADIYGPSIPTMFGLQGSRPKVRDVNGMTKIIPLESYEVPTISIGYIIEPEQAVVLRGPRLAAIIKQFVSDVLWPELDFLIVDLPPGTGDVQLTLVQTVPLTGVVMVTTPQDVALADALKAINMFKMEAINIPILGVVENMAWFTPAELPENKYYIFGEGGGKRFAHENGSVLLGQIPIVQSIREGGDSGKPAVTQDNVPQVAEAFMEVARNTLKQVEALKV
ncbi:MAG: Mrp/NBP35 family ATP-binding protein [Saprospiraceae bacterium]